MTKNENMDELYQDLAGELRRAYRSGPIPPLSARTGLTDVDSAYAVQSTNTRIWVEQGRRIIGRKIGLTSEAVQRQLGVDQPDFGVLFADMAIEDGGELLASQVLQPRAEAEVALVMARDLDNPEATLDDVLAATAYALPAIEIVDSRIADWKISFFDTVADNASSGFFVVGSEPIRLGDFDLATCAMVLEVNGHEVSTGVGANCLGHPLAAAAWLVHTLSSFGETLRAGDIVLTGALGPMKPISPGDVVRTHITGLGSAMFRYTNDL